MAPPPAPSAPPAAAAPVVFTDVPPGYWAGAAIRSLARAGILDGVAPARFAPEAQVTRAEFAAFLDRLAHAPGNTPGPAFTDVPASAWFAPAVEAATGNGWMSGEAPGTFAPNAPMTRAQALVALVRYLGLGDVANAMAGAPCPYRDCAVVPGWARGAVAVAGALRLVQGQPSGVLGPLSPLNRAQAAVLLARTQAVTPTQVEQLAAKVAASVDFLAPERTLEVGSATTVRVTARNAAGAPVPAGFQFTVSGPGRVVQRSQDQVAITASGSGRILLRAQVAGAGTSATLDLQGVTTASLAVSGAPPAMLAGAPVTLTLVAIQTDGQPDPAATAAVSVSLRPAARGVPAQVQLAGGSGSLALPGLPAGRYSLRLQLAGHPARTLSLRVVGHPLGRVQLDAPPQLASGAAATLGLAVPAGAAWPVTLEVAGQPSRPAALPGENAPPAVLTAPERVTAGGSAQLDIRAGAPGTATVTASVPGGALSPQRVTVRVTPTGAFGAAVPASPVQAGATATLAIDLRGTPTRVAVEPVDPAGHPLPLLTATVRHGTARARFTPVGAGTWHFRWLAPGWATVQAGSLSVTPGPAAGLAVSAIPSSVLLPGQQATLTATLIDRFGNPLSTAFRLQAGGTVPGMVLTATAGPGVIGSYTAGALGTATLTFRTAGLPAATLTFRTVASQAAKVAGPGMWLTFPDWRATPDATILREAQSIGATHIYLEVATSSDGFYGGQALDDLLWRAHAAGIAVIAWVYPALTDPAADMALVRQVAAYQTPAGDRADGLALDIEQQLDPATVAAYARAARQSVGPGGLLVGVTWPPQEKPDYPFRALAGTVNVFAPMDYWHTLAQPYTYAQVYRWVLDSVRQLRQLAGEPTVPVDVALETFDWFSPTGQGMWSPTADELAAALSAATAAGAEGASFYRPSTATPAEWAVMRSGA